MKKLLLLIVAVAFYSVSNAQYKAVKGDWTTDFGLSGGISNTVVSPHDAGQGVGEVVKLRYFNSDKSAIRGMLLIYNDKETETVSKVEEVSSESAFTIGVGYEKHFEGTDRLDPFLAGDILFKREGLKYDKTDSNFSPAHEYHQEGSNSMFGVRISIGADYYFAKKVYLGAELGLGLFKGVDGKSTTSGTGMTTVDVDGTDVFQIVPGMIGGFKIGYAF